MKHIVDRWGMIRRFILFVRAGMGKYFGGRATSLGYEIIKGLDICLCLSLDKT